VNEPDVHGRGPTGIGEAEEAELVSRVAAGDQLAFEQLYLHYHRRLARFLTRFASRYEIAEEVINDTMYVVWNKARDFRGDAKVSTWIFGIAYRRALKTLRAVDAGSETNGVAKEHEHAEASDDDAARERSDWVAHGLAQLPLEQRMVIEMAYFLGNSCDEIAQVMNCPVNTVKTRMFHARRRLRELLPRLAEPGKAVPIMKSPI
jgi:RNA polymerase sigma-70 factor (ECF subfamily)